MCWFGAPQFAVVFAMFGMLFLLVASFCKNPFKVKYGPMGMDGMVSLKRPFHAPCVQGSVWESRPEGHHAWAYGTPEFTQADNPRISV